VRDEAIPDAFSVDAQHYKVVQTNFDTSQFNSTYDELFNHLRDDIIDAIQSQIQVNG